MTSHNVYSLRNVFWTLGSSALQATDLLAMQAIRCLRSSCLCILLLLRTVDAKKSRNITFYMIFRDG